jgi:predicted RNA-binding Zn ribbon-like protein
MPDTPVPEHARLLADFANTLEIDGDRRTESIDSAQALAHWLAERDLLAPGTRVSSADLRLALALRSGLREALFANHDQAPQPPSSELDSAAARLPLRVVFAAGTPRLEPAARTAVERALGSLLVAVADASADGSWQRLKLCASETCQWAFYDASRNRCRNWCSMNVCGNRQKTRVYRARHRAGS